MKLSKIPFPLLLSLVFLQGCNDADKASPPPENIPMENDNDLLTNNRNEVTGDPVFNITSFDLDVDYSGTDSYEVEYENDLDGLEARIEDEINHQRLNGDEAFEQLRPIFEQFNFDQSTAEEEVMAEVLESFNLDNDFTKLELEVEYSDGIEKKYHSNK
jgi:hypothetical protein